MAGLNGRVDRLEAEFSPPRRPGTLADLVRCSRGEDDWWLYDFSVFAEVIEAAENGD